MDEDLSTVRVTAILLGGVFFGCFALASDCDALRERDGSRRSWRLLVLIAILDRESCHSRSRVPRS